jgi:PPM family protein phosphatase
MNRSLHVRGSLITNRGTKRPDNEDPCLFDRVFSRVSLVAPICLECSREGAWIVAIADGLGGQQGGERASAELVSALAVCADVSPSGVSGVLEDLHKRFVDLSTSHPEYAGLGSTVAGLAFGREGFFAFNVGDARVYRQQDRFLAQITDDDSIAQLLVNAAQGSEDDARERSSHRLTQAIGGRTEFKPIRPHVYPLQVKDVCRFLICSDGLTDALSLDEMEQAVAQNSGSTQAVQSLFDAACKAECKDNISIIVAEVISARAVVNAKS